MSQYLVVVESPAKAKTIKKYLGKEYTVKASVGHVKDLPKSKLGVDVEHDFAPEYQVIRGKGKVLQEIKKAAKSASKVFLAPDPDREGEAIAWHIAQELKGKKGAAGPEVVRVLFNEITKRAVQEAVQHPLQLDESKYNSQQARRILDRLVGYQISPLLWRKVRRGLSAGRVQSVAVRLVVEREREIGAFVAEEYWTIDALLAGAHPPAFTARLAKIDGKKAKVAGEAEARQIVAELEKADYKVTKVERKERRRKAPAPFITSRLQQEASNRLRFTAKKTMTLAQRLYEGVELGEEGSVGLITYMRTDSTRLSDEAVTGVREYIGTTFGAESVPEKPNFYKSGKQAQDAHEAIRPTSVEYPPEKVKKFLDRDMFRLYELIWKRFVACQMTPAVYDQTKVETTAGRYVLAATGSILKKAGWLAAYGERTEEDEERADKGQEDENGTGRQLPDLNEGETLKLEKLDPVQHFTQPPPRFNEASLVKELEEKGIGRPSTYASILSVIQDKEYVKKDEGRFHPTDLGVLVTDLLVESFPQVLDVTFTAEMENQLDGVEQGKVDYLEVLKRFYGPFADDPEEGRGAHARRQARGDPHRPHLREVRVGDGHQVGAQRALPRLLRLPRLQEHRRLPREGGRDHRGGGRGGDRREVPHLWQAHGGEARALRAVPRLLGLPRVQDQQAHQRRGRLPRVRQGLLHRAAQPPGQDLLRLQQLPRVQERPLGPAGGQALPPLREPVPAAEVHPEDRALPGVPQQGVRLQGPDRRGREGRRRRGLIPAAAGEGGGPGASPATSPRARRPGRGRAGPRGAGRSAARRRAR